MQLENRIERFSSELAKRGIDFAVCGLPRHVLLLTGYWPVLGLSLAVVSRSGRVAVIAPKDEEKFLSHLGGIDVCLFETSSIERKISVEEAIETPLSHVIDRSASSIGLVLRSTLTCTSYPAVNSFGDLRAVISKFAPRAEYASVDELLRSTESIKTECEIRMLELAIRNGARAFARVGELLQAGRIEHEVARLARVRLTESVNEKETTRADGFVYCMSGPRSADAFAAFQHSSSRSFEEGDAVLTHVNNYVNGYWTDITRTSVVGSPGPELERALSVVHRASEAALRRIRPGVQGREVDAAARQVIDAEGLKGAFKHTLGHGVGLAAIDHSASPELAPYSAELLEEGMVFNVEPAVYLAGEFGVRHCDVVLVTREGCRVLTNDIRLR